MRTDFNGTAVSPPTAPAKPGTPCGCPAPCPDPVACDRERRSSETEWIRAARRPVNWGWPKVAA